MEDTATAPAKAEVLMLTRETTSINENGTRNVSPEELISHLFAQVMAPCVTLKVASCSENLLDESDKLVGQYPILVYKHWIVPRSYIWQFWVALSNIDEKLSEDGKETAHGLSELLLNRFRALVVS